MSMRKTIHVGTEEIELQVHVGTVLLELENRESPFPHCKPRVMTEHHRIHLSAFRKARFMKTSPSLVDYAKYGPNADKDILGLADPKSIQARQSFRESSNYADRTSNSGC
jgi:methyl-coenzyme M reductase subunit D